MVFPNSTALAQVAATLQRLGLPVITCIIPVFTTTPKREVATCEAEAYTECHRQRDRLGYDRSASQELWARLRFGTALTPMDAGAARIVSRFASARRHRLATRKRRQAQQLGSVGAAA